MAAIASAPVTAILRAPAASAWRPARLPVAGGLAIPAARPSRRPPPAAPSARLRARFAAMGVGPAVSELALAGYDTSALDTLFVNAASIILPAWGAIVGTIFVFGTIAKVAFPDKYDAAVYKNKAVELVQDEIIDLDNLSPEDLAAVAALEAERAAEAKN